MNYTFFDMPIAKKYAQAFVALFSHKISLIDITKIEAAQQFLIYHKRVIFFLQLPQFNQQMRTSIVEDLIDYCSLPHYFLDLFLLLISHNRSFYIPAVLGFVAQLYKKHANIASFSIASSHHLDEKQVAQIKDFLERRTGKKIIGTHLIDKNLIAGIRLQSIEYMWEYSVRKQLVCLRALEKARTNR